MARIRQLKPEYWTDEKVANLSRDARLLFLGLWTEADDDGRLVDSAKLLAGSLFPFDEDVTPKRLTGWLDQIIGAGLVRRYAAGAGSYLFIVNFKRHQKIAHPRRSSLPPPEGGPSSSCDPPEERATDAGEPPAERAPDLGVKGSRGQGVKGVGVSDNSSSNHHGVAEPVGESEEELLKTEEPEPSAVDVIVSRKLQQRMAKTNLGPIGDQIAWLTKARANAVAEFGAKIAELHAQGLTIAEVANRLMPVPGSQYAAWVPPEDRVEAEPDMVTDEHGHLVVVPRRSA